MGGERNINVRERNTDRLPPVHGPVGDQTHHLGMCPDQESNPQPSDALGNAPTN